MTDTLKEVVDRTLSEPACTLLEEIIQERITDLSNEDMNEEMEALLINGLKMLPQDLRAISHKACKDMQEGKEPILTFPYLDEPYLEYLDSIINASVTDLAAELEEYILDNEELDDINDDNDVLGIDAIVEEPDAFDFDDVDDDDIDPFEDDDPNLIESLKEEISSVPSHLRDQIIILEELVSILGFQYILPGYSAITLRHLNALLD